MTTNLFPVILCGGASRWHAQRGAPRKRLIVYPGVERFSVGAGVEAIGLTELMHGLRLSRH